MKKQGFDIGRWQNEHSFDASSCRQLLLDGIEQQLDNFREGELMIADIDRIAREHPRIRKPLAIMRDRIVPNIAREYGDRSVYYPERRLFINMVKSDSKVRCSPVYYHCQRLDECPEGAAIMEEDKHEARTDLHRKTAEFIISMIDREYFTTDTLRAHLNSTDDLIDGLRRAGQEMDYFTRKMEEVPSASDGLRSWVFYYSNRVDGTRRDLLIQQTKSTLVPKTENCQSAYTQRSVGGSSLSRWVVLDLANVDSSRQTVKLN